MSNSNKPWWRRAWAWVATGIAALVMAVIAFSRRNRRIHIEKPRDLEPPPPPDTPDVIVPDAVRLDTNVADDYEKDKADGENIADAIASVNSRYK